MKKLIFVFVLSAFLLQSYALRPLLEGFKYGTEKAPVGNEWESPQSLGLNKEQPKAYFFPFADVESARKVLPENSVYWKNLNGVWKFNWVKTPAERPVNFYLPTFDVSKWDEIPVPSNWNVYGIQKDGSLKYGLPIYVNQKVIFEHKVKEGDWKLGVMREPTNKDWTTYIYRNEVGSYRRDFTIPQNWDGREVFLNFEGVDSFFYLWINGQYVGFSKNSRNTASFNISKYLVKGNNVLAVEVYRNSDGSFLEAQDMYRLPGIFRTVSLNSVPKVHIRDLNIIPDLDASYTDGSLKINADIRNLDKRKAKGYKLVYSLYAHKLYDDNNTLVEGVSSTAAIAEVPVGQQVEAQTAVMQVKSPNKWSAEAPYRYTLVAQLKDAKNNIIETVSAIVGFRKVEIKQTAAKDDEFGLAGRYYYVNGKTVKLKGVNRHENDPSTGHCISRERMTEEIMIMKRINVNHVRNSHYTDDPYWYYLCNKYGIYLEDEANIESHEYYYGKESLSHPAEWRIAHVARVMEMAHNNVNNPSIVIWSLGNEAGPGHNFVAAYDSLKAFDPSRPVQYERNNDIVDMGSNQYPSIGWMQGAVTGKYNIKYPFHVSEYAHTMGNAGGNLVDYWKAIESTNFFCGAAIWEWIDQSISGYDKKTGQHFYSYGGDFGDHPNDGQFIFKGVIAADLSPKPHYYEVKKVYQYIQVDSVNMKEGMIQIFNKNYFTDLSDYEMRWSLWENGTEIQSSMLHIGNLAARKKLQVKLPYDVSKFNPQSEYYVKVQFLLRSNMPWANKGYVQADEQLLVKPAGAQPSVAELTKASKDKLELIDTNPTLKTIKGAGFVAQFDMAVGTIYSLTYGNETIIADGNGPKLDAFRAYVNNDNWAAGKWFEAGLHNLKHKATNSSVVKNADGTIVLSFTVESQAPNGARLSSGTSSTTTKVDEKTDRPFGENDFKFITNQIYTIYKDGSIELQSSITSNQESLYLARLGYLMKVPQKYANFSYYGRGPVDNYNDRKTSQFVELHRGLVKNEFVPIAKPQNVGNHEDVRWCALTNNQGNGAVFVATDRLSVTALPYSAMDLTMAAHPYQLPAMGDTYLNLDIAVTGMGGSSCGPQPLEQDKVRATQHSMGFIIRPALGNDLVKTASVSASGVMPISIIRTRVGEVKIESAQKGAVMCYSINNSKPKDYTQPIPLREGGVVVAWNKQNPALKTSTSFKKIENIHTAVVFASSEEIGEGDAANLVDGDPNTIWHTTYSVTLAKYPHWVDLDAGEPKTIKGFTYLPRQDGTNGHIKNYSIHVSMDGKNWGEPILKAKFENNAAEKRVIFDTAVKARYIRFTALSEQRGQDYATGAEITIIAE